MKKQNILVLTVFVLILIFILFLKFFPFGGRYYKLSNKNNFKIPKISFLNESKENYISFKTIRGMTIIKKELEDSFNEYEKGICNNKTIFYDEKSDITIIEYNIDSGFIFNTFYIKYYKGKFDRNECSVIKDATKLDYQIRSASLNYQNRCSIPEQFEYKNNNGNKYNVYYDCFGDILFKTGLDEMNFLDSMLKYSWISMDTVVDFLKYQVKNGNASSEILIDMEATIYRNKGFSLLTCNTSAGNKDIYIGGTDFQVKENYCK